MGPLQVGREHSSTRPEQTAQNGGMSGRTLVTFASHPSEFVSRSLDPPTPPNGLVMGAMPVTDCQRSRQDHGGPRAWTAPTRDSSINGV